MGWAPLSNFLLPSLLALPYKYAFMYLHKDLLFEHIGAEYWKREDHSLSCLTLVNGYSS
jgi:hypothetical protein